MSDTAVAIIDAHGDVLRNDGGTRPIYSIAKTFIASLVIDSGLDPSAPISTWIDVGLVPRAPDITLRQLLTHTSGLRDYGALPAYAAAIAAGESPWSDETFAEHTLSQPLLFEPGTNFTYSNPGYWLLLKILETAHATAFDDLIAAQASRLGLTDTKVVHGQFADDLPNYPAGWVWHGVICASPLDVARFMARSSTASLMRDEVAVGAAPGWRNPHYGYGLMIEPGVMFGHNGNGPGYSAACFKHLPSGRVCCVLERGETPDGAFAHCVQHLKPRD